jgi:hypothetical protein
LGRVERVGSGGPGGASSRLANPEAIQTKNSLKENVEQGLLERQPGRHVILVRYTGPGPHDEWIYNPAYIDAASVIWARDM